MVNQSIDCRLLANTYRAALLDGRTALADSKIEQKILWAVVAASADDTATYIRTHVTDGNMVATPLDALVPDLKQNDFVGKTLKQVRTVLVAQAKSMILNGAARSVLYLWWTAVGVFIAGFVLRTILPTIAASGDAVGKLLFIAMTAVGLGPLAWVLRSAFAGLGNSGAGTKVQRLLAYPNQVGTRALAVFESNTASVLKPLQVPSKLLTSPRSLLVQTRTTARLIIYGAIVVAGLALAFFLYHAFIGFTVAWHIQHDEQFCKTSWSLCRRP